MIRTWFAHATELLLVLSVSGLAFPAYAQSPLSQADWQAVMEVTPRPSLGCFEAHYPDTNWVEVPCVVAPMLPQIPGRGTGSETVGGGESNDLMANVGSQISDAIGKFPTVSQVTSESDSTAGNNAFSLQLNTNAFTTPLCNAAQNPAACQGWQQFIYWNNPSSPPGEVFMQYWLVNYNTTCPTQWNTFDGGNGGAIRDCVHSSAAVSVGQTFAITSLSSLSLEGSAASSDYVILWDLNNAYYAGAPDSVLGLALNGGWTQAEFNVFGMQNGTQAIFNTGASMSVDLFPKDSNGNYLFAYCNSKSTTGETNNLTLNVGSCSSLTAPQGGITFSEFIPCPVGQTWCSGTQDCTSLATDPNNCGSCGNACPGTAHGYATCSSGICGLACNTGYHMCDYCVPNGTQCP